MHSAMKAALAGSLLLLVASVDGSGPLRAAEGKPAAGAPALPGAAATGLPLPAQGGSVEKINLADRLAAGKLKMVNRNVTKHPDRPDGIQVSESSGNGLVWVEGTDFGEGTIELDIRGRDVLQQSFVGVAFHGKDETYEAVYLRPFNFRAQDPVRHQHAVQYIAIPEYDWPRLRKEFPEEFENPVDQSIVPTDWVPVRVVVKGQTVQIYAGPAKSPALEVRKLGKSDRGMIGLWVGNTSDGGFANLRITPMK